jgi:hypothetical protein
MPGAPSFRSLEFLVLNLFRISDFEIRICVRLRPSGQTSHYVAASRFASLRRRSGLAARLKR